jgi:hypothetical protein
MTRNQALDRKSAEQIKHKRIGRPLKTPEPGERVSLGLRVTAATKQRLDDAARATGQTQSREAELLIEYAFRERDALGGAGAQQMARAMAAAFAFAGQRAAGGGSDWINDPVAYVAGAGAVVDLLFAGLPEGEDRTIALQGLISRVLTRIKREEEART